MSSFDKLQPGVSIIICCHNSAPRLPKTLAHLNEQKLGPNIPWEVIVVDNCSTDHTATVAIESWTDRGDSLLRVVKEPSLGLNHARKRGIAEAQYEFISFIDDDNWVCPVWVKTVYEVMMQHPEVGVCGGYSEAVCEITRPEWFEECEESYAVGPQGIECGDITWGRGCVWGAGLNIRRSAYNSIIDQGFRNLLVDRQGNILSSGGDTELCHALRLTGWRIWFEQRLTLKHYIPAVRLEWKYLRRIHRGFGAASVYLDPYYFAMRNNKGNLTSYMKSRWQFNAMLAFMEILKEISKIFFLSWPRNEGNYSVLNFDCRLGRFLELIKIRRVFNRNIMDVMHAQWARKDHEKVHKESSRKHRHRS